MSFWLNRALVFGMVLGLGMSVSQAAFAEPSSEPDKVVIQTLLLEARGEGFQGMQAVAEVIRQRSLEKGWDEKKVVLQPFQFSCWGEPSVTVKRKLSKFTAEDWQMARAAWEEARESHITRGANHYLNKKAVKYLPGWAKDWRIVARIGKHTFYKL